jgi:hypothetical protein
MRKGGKIMSVDETIIQHVYPVVKGKVVKDKKAGTFVAKKVDGKIHLGWSRCVSEDKFCKAVGLKIAKGRLNTNIIKGRSLQETEVPFKLRESLDNFRHRCANYFRDSSLINSK